MPDTILIIDDDSKLLNLLETYFKGFGFDIRTADHPESGLEILRAFPISLVILDVMLPDKDGIRVLKEIRESNQVPIIMLSGRGEVTDRIVGLELGADDYLPKPFEPRELVVRVQSVLRRLSTNRPSNDSLIFSSLTIDTVKRQALLQGQELDLSTAEFDLLTLLAQNPGSTYNRDQIIDNLKGTDWAAFHRSVDVLISRLRHKLNDDPKDPQFIKTIWGTGYRFIAGRKKHDTNL